MWGSVNYWIWLKSLSHSQHRKLKIKPNHKLALPNIANNTVVLEDLIDFGSSDEELLWIMINISISEVICLSQSRWASYRNGYGRILWLRSCRSHREHFKTLMVWMAVDTAQNSCIQCTGMKKLNKNINYNASSICEAMRAILRRYYYE
jgi:hypothetical protein